MLTETTRTKLNDALLILELVFYAGAAVAAFKYLRRVA